MTALNQQTLAAEASLEGVGLHSGAMARVRFVPAREHQGIVFRRMDLPDRPAVPARLEYVVGTDRGTTIGSGAASVAAIEPLLAAVSALQLDNLEIEIDGPEVPIMDGSFRSFFAILQGAGVRTQAASARLLQLKDPVQVNAPGGATYTALPHLGCRISATIQFPHPVIGRQFGSFDITPDEFGGELAAARTFGFVRDAEALRQRGLALGVTLDNALVLDDQGIINGAARWPDEFVRHKIGDIIGDLALTGARVQAHVIADRPSHAGNLELGRALASAASRLVSGAPIVDIQMIMEHLPHRYPMLLVDRVIEIEPGKRIVGIKNVTINEPFFQGHYPGHPVMPGVLIIEAMAQVGGLLLMDMIEDMGQKVVYFMTLDNVKWRRPVVPGDQIRFELEMLQVRRHTCRLRGVGYVDGHVVAEAEMMARFVDR
ncbi:MAG: UDP-3-O-[3-hydroxymyristoyl] N-acetylglucosamine deacetylase [Gemmatimonadetes bacterium]|nr:UDP-3-O-[3-hydroxymyristoyl] N-acetylglucosamine deacetylase [Gemmatimonadota bacterium]